VIPRYGGANPFHPSARTRLQEDDARKLVQELGRP
jgi:hypothetical protein